MSWNEERTELCVKLWNEGLSATEVARRLGGSLSRNAVIGKIHRLGLAHRTNTTRVNRFKVDQIKKARRARKPKPSESMRFGNVKSLEPVAATPLPSEPVKPDKLYSLFDLTDLEDKDRIKRCRFIYGDPKQNDSGYCGCEAAPGSSYCPGHQHLCTTAPTVGVRKITWNWNDKKPAARVPGRRREGVHCA